jgi:pyrroloquinoline quinone (PQQ) biosynthesis protein C
MYPRFKENIWHINPQQETALLITSQNSYQVPTAAALQFLKMRSHCTGWNSLEAVAEKSDMPMDDVRALLRSLEPADILCGSTAQALSTQQVREACQQACRIWSSELRLSYIGNEFASGELPKPVLIGWLLEMYHYIRDFPDAIEHAASWSSGPLKALLQRYANEERGHESFVLDTLVNLGLTVEEVQNSIPLLSTRLIGFLMRELFELEPAATLMVAAVVEAQEFDAPQIDAFKAALHKHYGIEASAFNPYFRHQEIDVGLGHAQLLEANLHLLDLQEPQLLDQVMNKIHDLKHAFDLQGIEIKAYFSALNGKYLPRQPVTFASI